LLRKLQRDNVKFEVSQCIKQVHRGLFITDQWAETHSPWKNPAELNGVKYLKSRIQMLIDRIGVQKTLWFLAYDYLACIM
jgi:hypothetical protein